jgi:acyl-coenzyme A thioesterase PaaI-like protein
MSRTLKTYNWISKFPMGNLIFSRALTFRVPFFTTISPLIKELRPGYCVAEIKDRRKVRNHLGSVNAGALCTFSELVGGLAVEASISSALRWIPKEMTVQYAKMAKGKLTGTCTFDPSRLVPGVVKIPFEIKDASGDAVLKVVISFYVSDRKIRS